MEEETTKQEEATREGEWVEVVCGFCRGARKNPFASTKCPVCGGRGKVSAQEPLALCAYCEGTGASGRMTCTVCSGKGVITIKGPVQACPACRGRGKDLRSEFRLPCIICGGRGVVPI